MSVIINIDKAYSTLPALPVERGQSGNPGGAAASRSTDRVELSQPGLALARDMDASSGRVARIRSIRAEIAAGTYETPERIAGTVSRLLDVIG